MACEFGCSSLGVCVQGVTVVQFLEKPIASDYQHLHYGLPANENQAPRAWRYASIAA